MAAGEEQETEGELFALEVPEGEESITFQAEGSGDIALVAQQGSIPSRDSHTYGENSSGGSETLTISNSGGLAPGTWYVRVLNNSLEPVAYSITGALGSSVGPELAIEQAGQSVILRWNGKQGVSYEVESSVDLVNWSTVTTVPGAGTATSVTLPQGDDDYRFYRVVRE